MTIILSAPNSFEQLKLLEVKLKQAIEELARYPTYGNAIAIQKLNKERTAIVAEHRSKVKPVFVFEKEVVKMLSGETV